MRSSGPRLPVAAAELGALERDRRAAASLGGAQLERQLGRLDRLVGDLDLFAAGAEARGPLLHPLGAHADPLAAVLVAVEGVAAAVDAGGAGRGAPADLAVDSGEPLALGDRLLVLADGPGAGVGALALVGVPAAGVVGRLAFVELDYRVGEVAEQRAVVGDEDDRAGVFGEQGPQAREAVGVEVVGRLVEEEHVGAGDAEGGEPGARGLPAGEAGERPVEQLGREPQLRRRGAAAAPRRPRRRGRASAPARPRARRSRRGRRGSSAAAWRSSSRVAAATPIRSRIASRAVRSGVATELRQVARRSRAARTVPASGASSPTRIRSRVDLPLPLRPTSAIRSPVGARRDRRNRARRERRSYG